MDKNKDSRYFTDRDRIKLKKGFINGEGFDSLYRILNRQVPQQFQKPESLKDPIDNLPSLKAGMCQYYEKRMENLKLKSSEIAKNLEERTDRTRKEINALHDMIKIAGSPPTISADPNKYTLSVKVIEDETLIGLPDLTVRLADPRKKELALSEGLTDSNGNIVFNIMRKQAEELILENVKLSIEILSLEEVLHVQEDAFVPRLNHVEMWVASLPKSKELEPYIEEVIRLKNERKLKLSDLHDKINHLKIAHDTMQNKIALQLEETNALIASIKGETASKPITPSQPSTPRRPEPSPSKPEPKPSSKKAKKKRTAKKQEKPARKVAKPKIVKKEAAKRASKKKAARKKAK